MPHEANPFARLLRLFRPKTLAPDLAAAQDVAFLPLDDFRIADCPLCAAPGAGARLSVYPATPGSRMRGRIVWWCGACGSGVVPRAREFLAGYYARDYASELKKDREIDPADYFSPEMERRTPDIANPTARARQQIEVLRSIGGRFDAVLDFGSGPGYFLKALDPPVKLAVELDENSQKYLRHIGARSVTLDELADRSLDLVMASHSLEHLCAEDLDATLAAFAAKLTPGGLLYVEVPQGALTALELPNKHEPHTIFFSPAGLEAAVRRSGLEIVRRSYRSRRRATPRADPAWSPDPSDDFQSVIRGGMTIVARRVGN